MKPHIISSKKMKFPGNQGASGIEPDAGVEPAALRLQDSWEFVLRVSRSTDWANQADQLVVGLLEMVGQNFALYGDTCDVTTTL